MVRTDYSNYLLPSSDLLTSEGSPNAHSEKVLLDDARTISETLAAFEVYGLVVNIAIGPVFTIFEFKNEPGTTAATISKRADDLSLALAGRAVKVSTPVGKSFVAIEVLNERPQIVRLREVFESTEFQDSDSLLTLAVGKTMEGKSYVNDLALLPHLLVAGATGSGKSSCLHSIILSILYKARPDEIKFILIDPRRVELGVYADIPHLTTPVITALERAATSLQWAVSEAERRQKDFVAYGVPTLDFYNREIRRRNSLEELDDFGEPYRTLPYVVIVIDEIGELLAGADRVSEVLSRLAATGRAVGIHLVVSTGRPSAEVITSEIKANFPARVAFSTVSRSDSRTILDAHGAEELKRNGDALFLEPKTKDLIRVHAAYADFVDIKRVVDFVKSQGSPEYETDPELDADGDLPGRRDPLFVDALQCVVQAKRASTSLLQRHLKIGYGRAAAILDAMVRKGYVGEMNGNTRSRPILAEAYEALRDFADLEEGLLYEQTAGRIQKTDNDLSDPSMPLMADPNSTGFGAGGAISILFFVITILLVVASCSGKEMSYLLCITPITGLISFVALALELADGNVTSGQYYPATRVGGRRGRPPKLFGRSRKSSIIKSIKRDIRKYGD